MTDTPARLLKLLSLLQTPREWPGGELAERLDVSPRTVRRDIDRLRELGYPVEASRGSLGGYRLVAGAAMPPLVLDDEEAVAIAVGLRAGAGHAIEGVDEASVRALAKLEQVLPSRLRHRVSALQNATVPLVRGDGATIDPQTLTTLASAATGQERLRFSYRSGDGTETKRQVEPYRLVSTGRRWYLVAYDLLRADWRTFRVDRVSEPFATGARFTPRPLPVEGGEGGGGDGGRNGQGGDPGTRRATSPDRWRACSRSSGSTCGSRRPPSSWWHGCRRRSGYRSRTGRTPAGCGPRPWTRWSGWRCDWRWWTASSPCRGHRSWWPTWRASGPD
ncbi:helix-turn-helix transcriptional regulator [Streptomyces microflavus]